MKIAIVANKPIHYRIDFFNRLVFKFQKEISFYFVISTKFTARNKISVFHGEPFHKNSFLFAAGNTWSKYFKFLSKLFKDKPDIIVDAGMSLRISVLSLYAAFFKKKLIIWWGGTVDSEKDISMFKKIYRKIILFFVDGAICYSQLSAEYLLTLKSNFKNFFIIGNNMFDSLRYYDKISQIIACDRSCLNSKITLLTVAYLIPRKNVFSLLKVYERLRDRFNNINLIIVGEGMEYSKYVKYCVQKDIPNVKFEGFVGPGKMPYYYANADICIIPSLLDQWPQTYNEAASSGLPVVISDKSGVFNDYVETYRDQILFNPEDEAQLEYLLQNLIANRPLRRKLGRKALEDALQNDVKKATRVFLDCVNSVQ